MAETNQTIKVFPNNFEAEKSVLCSVMIDGDAAREILSGGKSDLFYNERNRRIFDACLKLYKEQSPVDMVTVYDQLEKSNQSDLTMLNYLGELNGFLPSAANYKEYYDILLRDFVMRNTINVCNEIIEDAYTSLDAEATLNRAAKKIHDLNTNHQKGTLEHISKGSNQLLEKLQALIKDKNAFTGLKTYFPILDEYTNGLQKGDLIILAARPAVGKTSFALNIVSNLVHNSNTEKVVAMFSLEMPIVHLAQRIMSTLTDIDMKILKTGGLDSNQMEQLWGIHAKMSECNLYVDDSSFQTPGEVYAKCQKLKWMNGGNLDLIIIDYLQLMGLDTKDKRRSDTKTNEVAEISRMLKILARDIGCPVIVLSQMARSIENREDKTPRNSDLRDSGAIEQDADIILFLSKEHEEDKGDKPSYNVFLDITKHRNGRTGAIRYVWEGANVRFYESDNQKIDRELQALQKSNKKFNH